MPMSGCMGQALAVWPSQGAGQGVPPCQHWPSGWSHPGKHLGRVAGARAAGADESYETSVDLPSLRGVGRAAGSPSTKNSCGMQSAWEICSQPCPLPGFAQLHTCACVWAPPGHTGGCQPDTSSPAWVVGGPGKILLDVDLLPKSCSSPGLGTLHHHPTVAFLAMNISALQKTRRCPISVERARGGDVPFFSPQMYGKWYDVAIGTTCKWMKNYKEKFSMGTLVLGPGPSTDQISTASTRLRYGALTWVLKPPPKPPHPGVLHLPGAGTRHGGCLLWLASEP